jgi:integrase
VARRKLGSVYKRGQYWWVRYSFRNREYRESSKSVKKGDALALLQKRISEVHDGRLLGPQSQRTTFDDLVTLIEQDYASNGRRSVVNMRLRVKKLREDFERVLPVDVSHAMLAEYVEKRLAKGAATSTVRYEIAMFGRMFTLAVRGNLLGVRPVMPTVKVSNTREGFFTTEEVGRVISHLPSDLCAMIAFTYASGWRIGEVRSLKWANVDFSAGTVRLEPGTTKNEDARLFPFGAHPALEGLLRSQRERVDRVQKATGAIIPWVFPRDDGRQLGDFRKVWAKACEKAGVPGRLVHDLRRSAVRNLERANVPRSWATKLTGHKTESIYRRYAIVSESDLSEAVKKLTRDGTGS